MRKYLGGSTERTLIFISSEKPELLSSNAAKSLIGTKMIDKSLLVAVNKTLCLPKFVLLSSPFSLPSFQIMYLHTRGAQNHKKYKNLFTKVRTNLRNY